jgi:hypothetical protein
MSYTKLAQDIFIQYIDRAIPVNENSTSIENEDVITGVDQFIPLIVEIIQSSKEIYNIPDTSVLIPVENFPRDLAWKLNNGQSTITDDTKKQLTIVTYSANELPEQVSSHSPYSSDGIRNIKPKLIGTYPDPIYEGYSIAQVGKGIEATIDFLVWGLEDKGIRERAKLLRQIIRDNTWYLKHKGLKEIVWLGSTESDKIDKQNIVQYKRETYKIVFTEIQQLREKNIEQILVTLALNRQI